MLTRQRFNAACRRHETRLWRPPASESGLRQRYHASPRKTCVCGGTSSRANTRGATAGYAPPAAGARRRCRQSKGPCARATRARAPGVDGTRALPLCVCSCADCARGGGAPCLRAGGADEYPGQRRARGREGGRGEGGGGGLRGKRGERGGGRGHLPPWWLPTKTPPSMSRLRCARARLCLRVRVRDRARALDSSRVLQRVCALQGPPPPGGVGWRGGAEGEKG